MKQTRKKPVTEQKQNGNLILIISALILIVGLAVYANMNNLTGLENKAGEAARSTRPGPTPECSDSDNGQNPNIAGNVVITKNRQMTSSASDACQGSSAVTEYYCQTSKSSSISSATINCAKGYGCKNGACSNDPPAIEMQIQNPVVKITETASEALDNIMKSETVYITLTGHDDYSLALMRLYVLNNKGIEEEVSWKNLSTGESILPYPCLGTVCSKTFGLPVSSNFDREITFTARAYDSTEQASATASGIVTIDYEVIPD